MKSYIRNISTATALLICSIALAVEPDGAESLSPNASTIIEPSNPNHLEPIPAYEPYGYDQAVFSSLLGKEPGEIWMIGKPSFSPEYAVILRNKLPPSASEFDKKNDSGKWVVEYAEVKKQIWRWKELDSGTIILDIKATKEVTRRRAEVTREFAELMIGAWKSVLRQTRYTDHGYRGCDGATFQFYCRYNLFGEIWSPTSGIPKQITDLGHKLGEVARAEAKGRDQLISECIAMAQNLTATNTPEQAGAGYPPQGVGSPDP